MVEKSDLDNSSKSPDLLSKWQNGPVILASSSPFRLKTLQKLGFQNVTTQAMPDALEKDVNYQIIENKGPSWQDPYSYNLPELVAESKLEYLISQNHPPNDALLVSLDTLAMAFRYTPKDHQIPQPMWSSHPFPKAETLEDLRKIMLSNFRQITKADRHFSEITSKMLKPKEAALNLGFGYLPRLIMINTGLALRLPNQPEIVTARISSRLELNHVYSLNNNIKDLKQLIDQIFAITEKSGRSPLKISGGIDYGNPEILKLLDAKEILIKDFSSTMEKGIFLGFPDKFFMDFLSKQAREQSH